MSDIVSKITPQQIHQSSSNMSDILSKTTVVMNAGDNVPESARVLTNEGVFGTNIKGPPDCNDANGKFAILLDTGDVMDDVTNANIAHARMSYDTKTSMDVFRAHLRPMLEVYFSLEAESLTNEDWFKLWSFSAMERPPPPGTKPSSFYNMKVANLVDVDDIYTIYHATKAQSNAKSAHLHKYWGKNANDMKKEFTLEEIMQGRKKYHTTYGCNGAPKPLSASLAPPMFDIEALKAAAEQSTLAPPMFDIEALKAAAFTKEAITVEEQSSSSPGSTSAGVTTSSIQSPPAKKQRVDDLQMQIAGLKQKLADEEATKTHQMEELTTKFQSVVDELKNKVLDLQNQLEAQSQSYKSTSEMYQQTALNIIQDLKQELQTSKQQKKVPSVEPQDFVQLLKGLQGPDSKQMAIKSETSGAIKSELSAIKSEPSAINARDVTEAMLYHRVGPKRADAWECCRQIAPSEHLPPEKDAWTNQDAVAAYCLKCKQVITMKNGNPRQVLRHYEAFHNKRAALPPQQQSLPPQLQLPPQQTQMLQQMPPQGQLMYGYGYPQSQYPPSAMFPPRY
jgi:hypothetical protein